jgi:hypothetical protein
MGDIGLEAIAASASFPSPHVNRCDTNGHHDDERKGSYWMVIHCRNQLDDEVGE